MAKKPIENICPLSPMQRGLLFHSLHEPELSVYYQSISLPFTDLDADALREAWTRVIERHSVLRTAFVWENREEPLQVVFREAKLPWTDLDWRDAAEDEREARLQELLAADRREGFDFKRAPLMRFALIRLSERESRFVWSSHHILFDGWSMILVFREVSALYESIVRGEPLALPPARPYSDYISWLRRQDPAKAEPYWREAMAGFTTPTPIGNGRTRHDIAADDAFREQDLRLSAESTAALQALAKRNRLTLGAVVQGAWSLLLSRYSGQPDVLFGATVFGRPADLAGSESMVGLFINALPMRVKVDEDETLLEWLGRLQAQQTTARQFEHCSLLDVQGWSDLSRGKPMFDSILSLGFSYEGDPGQTAELDDLNIVTFQRAHYPLTVRSKQSRDLLLGVTYDRRRFDDGAVARMIEHLRNLLEGMAYGRAERIRDLALLGDEEQHRMLVEWNETAAPLDAGKPIAAFFEEQADARPDAPAVTFADVTLTYRELDHRANRLAWHLRGKGVRRGDVVGICLDRSADMILSMLAILKAGGAYLPLDPEHPAERLAYMLEDAGARVVITEERWSAQLTCAREMLVVLEHAAPAIAGESEERLGLEVAGEDTAHVIYTSGSTGRPKGVVIPQRGVARLVLGTAYISLGHDDVVTQTANAAFDAATFEIWGALLNGCHLVIVPREVTLAPARLAAFVREHGVTVLFLTTALFNQVSREEPSAFASLRNLFFGGEAVDPRAVREVLAHGRPGRLLHVYGPTENTTYSTWHLVEHVGEHDVTVPIGRPIDNSTMFVLDARLRPVPAGVAGELYVGGIGLAHGYHGRPDLTAERFVPSPFGPAGSRLYRTGDHVVQREDGAVEFLGRIDNQVKIRGFRIELGEIEAVLRAEPGVREVVVLARDGAQGGKRLVAYVVAGPDFDVENLRASLALKLPSYMVPSAFVVMDALPLTPNGKVHHAALPAPEQAGSDAHVAPRTPSEELVAGIWREVLGVERIGVHDNFFDLGGHSLLAMQVVSRIGKTFEREMPTRVLFEEPTVAGVAAWLDAHARAGAASAPIARVARTDNMPLSFAQERLWFIDRMLPGSAMYNVPLAYRLRGELDRAALEASLNEIVRRHESLRTSFPPTDDGQPRQRIHDFEPRALELIEVDSEQTAERLAQEDADSSFDLFHGPLFRTKLLRLGEQDHVLVMTFHHIVADGWSLGVFFGELTELYETFRRGETPRTEEPPIQYADFAVWQRQWLSGEELERQLAFWKEALRDLPAVLNLPTDRPRPAVQQFVGDHITFALPVQLSRDLEELSRKEGATLFLTLLASFHALLGRYTGQQRIAVGTPVAGRNRVEIESLIGMFVNTLVLCGDLEGDPSFRELLGRVRAMTMDAFAHQDLPFEKLVEELRPERDLSHAPLFQAMFVLQNASVGPLTFGDVSLSPVVLRRDTAKFDLTVSAAQTEEGLIGEIEYNSVLFDRATVERMFRHWQVLLEAVVRAPETRVSRVPLLAAEERAHTIAALNDPRAAFEEGVTLADLFERQADVQPDTVALVYGSESLTYRELNRRANQLAHRLQELHAGPDVLVGIYLERRIELVVAIWAVLKAGAAYVPLDPAYPAERITAMLGDAEAPVVLTSTPLLDRLPQHGGVAVCVDRLSRTHPFDPQSPLPTAWGEGTVSGTTAFCLDGTAPDRGNPSRTTRPENLAYVIYTSGSTGRPKGVAIEHRSTVAFAQWATASFGEELRGEALASTSVCFDVSIVEMIVPLIAGGTIVLVENVLDLDTVRGRNLTIMSTVPSAVGELLKIGGLPPTLRVLNLGGEALKRSVVDAVHERHPHVRVFNCYGPTEDTTYTTVTLAERGETGAPAIGRPISNSTAFVLDQNLEPVPLGIPGELYLGGEGLARGYWNRPDLTAERFVPSPFGDGERLYRVGDLVRHRKNGQLEYLGRLDHQVKVRGFRIELGEIESVLSAHPAVAQVVVVAHEDAQLGTRLVCYYEPKKDRGEAALDLRAYLKQRLPDYMVPSVFVELETMPMSPNGKIDRHRLPAVAAIRSTRPYVAPRTDVERKLAAIWAGVLAVQSVGVHDNFFDLGGHSLLALRLVARVQKELGCTLAVAELFHHPTIEELAAAIAERGTRTNAPLVTMRRGGARAPLFFIHPVGGGVLCYAALSRHLHAEQPFYGIQSPLMLDGAEERYENLGDLAARYVEIIRGVQPEGPYRLGGWSLGGVIAFEIAQQLDRAGDEVSLLALIDSHPPDERLRVLSDADVAAGFAFDLMAHSPAALAMPYHRFGTMSLDERLDLIMSTARGSDLLDPDMTAAQFRRLYETYEANVRMYGRYEPRVYDGRIHLFSATEQVVQAEHVRDAAHGWNALSAKDVEVIEVPGNHHTVVVEPLVGRIGTRLNALLEEASSSAQVGPLPAGFGSPESAIEGEL
ncbi:MAG TPA: amino acid adenylation domain-containing protein [Thermoanaerobaculia bacterium]|nr:amino acid adenylation domain-containing protein [Thermoanaerobaculia bacterium]